jgi:CheY-like chemotaxis protein
MSNPHYPCGIGRETRRVVLLVEDERFVREATGRILESAGFEVLSTADTQEALQIYEENRRRINLLMTDLVLPNGNGRKLGDDIRRRSPGIPILLTSGYLCADERESAADGTYHLAKPYSKSDLLEKLAEIFRMPVRAAAQAG